MIFWGFLLAWVVEGFFLIGGRTFFTEILGWENAPKPISTALDAGRQRLVDVLGVTDKVPGSYAQEPSSPSTVINQYQTLSPGAQDEVRANICIPPIQDSSPSNY